VGHLTGCHCEAPSFYIATPCEKHELFAYIMRKGKIMFFITLKKNIRGTLNPAVNELADATTPCHQPAL